MAYMRDARGSRLDDFDPTRDVPGLVGWWDFTQLDSLADGSSVRRVRDASPFGHDLVAVATYNPTKQTGSDGHAVARFNGSYMESPLMGFGFPVGTAITGPLTIFAVTKPSSTQVQNVLHMAGGIQSAGQTRFLVNGQTGCVYGNSGGVTSSVAGVFTDDAWHVAALAKEPGALAVYDNGVLVGSTQQTATASDDLKGFSIGASTSGSANKFAGDFREVLVFAGRLTAAQMKQVSEWLSDRAPVDIPIGLGAASAVPEDTTSSNGQTVRIWEPPTVSPSKTLVLWSHQHTGTKDITPALAFYALANTALANGWYFAASTMHGDSWGNATALADLLDLYNLMDGRYGIDNVILVGESMGGLATASAISKGTVPKVRGGYFVDAVLSLADQYAAPAYTATIKTAYGIASDGSDYAAKTAGFDPMLLTASTFNKRLRFVASSADTNVVKTLHTDPFRTKVAGGATESGLVTHLGGHLVGGAHNPHDFAAFVKRCLP